MFDRADAPSERLHHRAATLRRVLGSESIRPIFFRCFYHHTRDFGGLALERPSRSLCSQATPRPTAPEQWKKPSVSRFSGSEWELFPEVRARWQPSHPRVSQLPPRSPALSLALWHTPHDTSPVNSPDCTTRSPASAPAPAVLDRNPVPCTSSVELGRSPRPRASMDKIAPPLCWAVLSWNMQRNTSARPRFKSAPPPPSGELLFSKVH